MNQFMDWVDVNDRLPEEGETVWVYNTKLNFVTLASLQYYDVSWFWTVSNGTIFAEDAKIVSECELDDEYEFTHWHPLPELPKRDEQKAND